MIKDADRFKMDLIGGLERTLHGQVKPSMLLAFTANLETQANDDSDNPMLNATSVRRSQRARRILPHRQSKNLRAATVRSPTRRLPRTSQHERLPRLGSRPQRQQDKQASICSCKSRTRGQEIHEGYFGHPTSLYQSQCDDNGTNGRGDGGE